MTKDLHKKYKFTLSCKFTSISGWPSSNFNIPEKIRAKIKGFWTTSPDHSTVPAISDRIEEVRNLIADCERFEASCEELQDICEFEDTIIFLS